jgi:hypothetical protein
MSYSNQVFKNSETGQLFDIFTTPQSDIIPTLDLTYDLGSPSKRWDDLYCNELNFDTSFSSNVITNSIQTNNARVGNVIFGDGPSQLNYYNEITITATWSGPVATPFTSQIFFTRIGRVVHFTFASIPNKSITSISNLISSTNTIPSDMIPSQFVPIVSCYINNTTYTPLLIQFAPSGVILLSPCVATGSVVSFSPFFNPSQFYCDRISGSYTI